uniref:Uncharacterized protein n=1 Tax=Odontella aurita TaxID=265563 RepID=A0A7S4HUS3_9STRA|mmetsp:Transcript_15570/g.44978  ORF Transcript_15570/g.44978 Transcript_15570/m.44978 type:complete len:150 (+) Transcript_15570:86-535(+)|eukprot:CAMPEP_0113542186 /NCGR_PEP_ID=MMETSP0015_2-20120614/9462_1 /TAXON_ID=2838 /ORGANISM="Odontella" /LENGTH=149 /DNA_ID=CAMNT_0000442205 /DNA_START=75 /DNA_END=524 /DNA_ORIENTATION=- /assembly_acc=CAM_ASM_000160
MRSLFRLTSLFLAAVSVAAFCPAPALHFSAARTALPRSTTHLFMASIKEWEAAYLARANTGSMQPEMVYTLVYNPYTEEEGVHTTRMEESQGSGEALLVFESIEECNRFAQQLGQEPSVPGQPVTTPMPLVQAEQACQQMGWTIMVVPE